MLLQILVLSHERPLLLSQQLSSLSSFMHCSDVSVSVSDNSLASSTDVSKICSAYPTVSLRQIPGGSQQENFLFFTEMQRHKYLLLLHDDDVIHISSIVQILDVLRLSNHFLFYIASYEVMPNSPFKYKKILPFPIDWSGNIFHLIFPHQLPSFPSYVYLWDEQFITFFTDHIINLYFGKYSDTGFISSYIDCRNTKPQLLDGLTLFHRWHRGSDSNSFDGAMYLKLFFYSIPRMSNFIVQSRSFLFFTREMLLGSFKMLLNFGYTFYKKLFFA